MRKTLKVIGIVLIVLWVLPIAVTSVPQTTSYLGEPVTYIPIVDEIIPLWVNDLPASLVVILPYLAILALAIMLTKIKTKGYTREVNNACKQR